MKTLDSFIQSYSGSSFPTLAKTTDGSQCVVKMVGAGNGPKSLISEFVVNQVASQLGWPVPQVFPVFIPHNHPWKFGTDEFDDLLQKSYGVNLGIEWIPEAHPASDDEVRAFSDDLKSSILALDFFFANIDRTFKSKNLLKDNSGKFWMIDQGGCLVFQTQKSPSLRLMEGHIFIQEFERLTPLVSEKLAQLAEFNGVDAILNTIPEEWMLKSGLDHVQLKNIWNLE